jgi:hypothetical protein
VTIRLAYAQLARCPDIALSSHLHIADLAPRPTSEPARSGLCRRECYRRGFLPDGVLRRRRYVLIADCALEFYPAKPPPLKYEITFLNNGGHLPADEEGLVPFFVVVWIELMAFGSLLCLKGVKQVPALIRGVRSHTRTHANTHRPNDPSMPTCCCPSRLSAPIQMPPRPFSPTAWVYLRARARAHACVCVSAASFGRTSLCFVY